MKKIIRILSFVAILILPICLTGCSKTVYDDNGNEYIIKGDEASFSEAAPKLVEVVIVNEIEGVPVTKIDKLPFLSNKEVEILTIPNSVATIEEEAFHGTNYIKKVILEDGNDHFKLIDGNLYSSDSTRLIRYMTSNTNSLFTLPSQLTTIGDYAFAYSTFRGISLSSSNLITIGNYAFYASGIEMATLPNTVDTLGEWAFSSCSKLSYVKLSTNIKEISKGTFNYCTSLNTLELHDGLEIIGYQALNACESITTINIPNTVTAIHNEAFSDCKYIKSIFIPESVTAMGENVFKGCSITVSTTLIEKPSGWNSNWDKDATVIWGVSV